MLFFKTKKPDPISLAFIQHKILTEGVYFTVSYGQQELSGVSRWKDKSILWQNGEKEKALILFQYLEKEIAEVKNGNSIYFSHQDFSFLEQDDIIKLSIGTYYPYGLSIRCKGSPADDDFSITYQFIDLLDNTFIGLERKGVFVCYGNRMWILPRPMYELVEYIDHINAISDKNLFNKLLAIARIKRLANIADVEIDRYLEREQIISPDKIKIKLEKDEHGGIHCFPEFESEDSSINSHFAKQFLANIDIRDIYNIPDKNGERIRILIEPNLKNALKKIKSNSYIEEKQKEIFINNPEAIFEDPLIEIDDFSTRVKEIGIFRYRVFPFITSQTNNWIPDDSSEQLPIKLELDGAPDEEPVIIYLDKYKLEILKQTYLQAVKEHKLSFEFDGKTIIIEGNLEKKITIIEDSYQQYVESKKTDKHQPQDKLALIISDNIEQQEYTTEKVDVPEPIIKILPTTLRIPHKEILFHQRKGINWLHEIYEKSRFKSGGLLADDMGLGKTLQILTFLESLKETESASKPYLIVAPAGLLQNWFNEFNKFFHIDDRDIMILNDFNLSRLKHSSKNPGELNLEEISNHDYVLASYETIRNNQLSLCKINWGIVILDEAQKIKNPTILTTHAIKALKSDFNIASTGTPIENNLTDLWSIMDFVSPGIFGCCKDFVKEFQPKSQNDYQALSTKIMTKADHRILRRKKLDILEDLPQLEKKYISIKMTQVQETLYTDCVAHFKNNKNNKGITYIETLQKLRKISCYSPGLARQDLSALNSKTIFEFSNKFKWLTEAIKRIQEQNEKVIIFTELMETQRILSLLISKFFNIDMPMIINGTVSPYKRTSGKEKNRWDIINDFEKKKGFNILIMSPIAGGTGLTITEANHVIHLMRHWNPSKEDQATDRVFRIGQKRPVSVYYPLTISDKFKTFDIILNDLIERKRKLADNALFPTIYNNIEPEELAEVIDNCNTNSKRRITLNDIEHYTITDFINLIKLIYKKKGYIISDCPQTSRLNFRDGFMATNIKERLFVFCHFDSKMYIDNNTIGEVTQLAKNFSVIIGDKCQPVIAANQNIDYKQRRQILQNTTIFDRNEIDKLIKHYKLFSNEI